MHSPPDQLNMNNSLVSSSIPLAIVGAGPYGLSIAAYLRQTDVKFRIFGTPMKSWREQMPKGMLLKSDGFASSLYGPNSQFELGQYCAENNIPYADVGLPVPLETFVAYGLEFQKRCVPNLEETDIVKVSRSNGNFQLETKSGESFSASQVILAAGISHFGYLPPILAALPREYVSHSSDHKDMSQYRGKHVAVIGAGASAVDIAALLHEAGAQVELLARRDEIAFHAPSKEPRPFLQRLANPRSGLGLGWKSRLCSDTPLLFHAMPRKLRFRAVERHLGPAPGWFVRDKVIDRFPMHLGIALKELRVQDGNVKIDFTRKDGSNDSLLVDHVIGATGYRVALSKMKFVDEDLRKQIRVVNDTPVLDRHFESSVPGLYFVGIASANSFGPLTRFAYGARFTAQHLSQHLAAKS